jgi:YLP motif-containing protein 1
VLPLLQFIGSGKSYLAKALRDLEVENGGNAPRIHSMDDYFMIEVEKVS